jgi:SNF2 family DNA or RNA helicase
MDIDQDVDVEQRFREYSRDWKCKECVDMPAKVSGLVAWKPVDEDTYDPAQGFEGVEEENKVYLVRWEGMSYFRARWMPGPWVWGVSAHSMRKAFAKREDAQHPKMRTEDAIPEDYLRTDIVLNIKFTSIVDIRTEEIDKARIREVEKALIKYKGLTYEDAVWEAPPTPEDGPRWADFVTAYNDWVAGRYVRQPKAAALKTRLEKVRKDSFQNLEKTTQPDNIEGGTLMEYQMQGLNWLYYKWYCQSNAVLADEMGLGKTIQIIGFLATLVQDHSCYPFLVVVPNSTCPNWRREIKRWAPSLRVVAYYGSRESRDSAYRYELYPENSKDLRCHIVVTSYDAAADENCRKFFRGVAWQGLIVDEGQRLKNDKNLLYSALGALKTPFKILLTGTPLQNNQRELFNLLHFLDDTKNAAELEEEFQDLDQNSITKLHDLIRPFFLRRTKAQVLTFLPPMAQIIVPVSMSVVQKKLYRSIMSKNPELMKAIFNPDSSSKQNERGSLNNIIMQLRKCLCHPFVYSRSIEDKNVDIASSHRNLVDASSKLQFLELLLPKLQQRGHRVLIFSQFLDMLDMVEDFLDGMQLRYQRLDGQVSSLNKQKRIDEFNATDSPLFAFLLSTRAGGVGINLASADTVIILDPDFNPHQDIQALSRAHRIGQEKKVLCFQLVTRLSAEERIMQIGKKKLALDHVLIQEMDADDAEQTDLVSVLRHGASAVFDNSNDQDITFSDADIERLLDRSHIEKTPAGADKSAEESFSFARVWANDRGRLEETSIDAAQETAPDPGVWDNILKERERIAAEDAAARAEDYGRGRRARANVDYAGEDKVGGVDTVGLTPVKRRRKRREGDESDTDFQADESEDDEVDGENGEMLANGDMDLGNGVKPASVRKKLGKTPQKPTPTAKTKPTPRTSVKKARKPAATPKVSSAVKKSVGLTGVNIPSPSRSRKRPVMSNFKDDALPVGTSMRWSFDTLDPDIPSSASRFNNTGSAKYSHGIITISDDEDEKPALPLFPSSPTPAAQVSTSARQSPTSSFITPTSPVPSTPALTTQSSSP